MSISTQSIFSLSSSLSRMVKAVPNFTNANRKGGGAAGFVHMFQTSFIHRDMSGRDNPAF